MDVTPQIISLITETNFCTLILRFKGCMLHHSILSKQVNPKGNNLSNSNGLSISPNDKTYEGQPITALANMHNNTIVMPHPIYPKAFELSVTGWQVNKINPTEDTQKKKSKGEYNFGVDVYHVHAF